MKKVQQCCLAFVLCFCLAINVWAQSSTPPAHAITNVTIHFHSGKTIDDGTIVWRDGIIRAVGKSVEIPFDAYVIDGGDSLHIYPGFIDGLALWGSPDRPEVDTPDHPGNPGYKRAGIQPQRQPNEVLEKDDTFEKAVKRGFTTAAIGLKGEMLPGQVDLFFLRGDNQPQLYKKGVGVLAQFKAARGSAYPSTTMGVMAKFRQLFYNAKALQTHIKYFNEAPNGYPAPNHSDVLEALFSVLNNTQPFYFIADHEEYIERIYWLQDEFDFNFVLVSGKQAYKRASSLKQKNIPVFASFDLPKEPEWHKKEEDEEVSELKQHFRQRQLKAYKAAIHNIANLIEAGVKVGYVSNGMKLDKFHDNLVTLHEDGGLSTQQILQILTENTAEILGIDERLGSLQEGYIASFSVFTNPFLKEKAQVWYSVSNGQITELDVEPKSNDSEDKDE